MSETAYEVVGATIADAESLAEREAKNAIAEARGYMKKAANALRPVARSPLFGNGLAKGLTNMVCDLDTADDSAEALQVALHEHFHGSDE